MQRRLDGEQVDIVDRLVEIQLEQELRDCNRLQAGKRMVPQKMVQVQGEVVLHELVLAIPNRGGEVVLLYFPRATIFCSFFCLLQRCLLCLQPPWVFLPFPSLPF